MAKSEGNIPVERKASGRAGVSAAMGAHPLMRLHREIDDLFGSLTHGWPRLWDWDPFAGLETPSKLTGAELLPRVDISETDNAYEICAELPGLEEKDVNVTLRGHQLTISGEKKSEREEKKKDYYLSERSFGSFHRSFQVPDDVQDDKVAANFSKGVLTVTLPKDGEKATRRKIEVKTK